MKRYDPLDHLFSVLGNRWFTFAVYFIAATLWIVTLGACVAVLLFLTWVGSFIWCS